MNDQIHDEGRYLFNVDVLLLAQLLQVLDQLVVARDTQDPAFKIHEKFGARDSSYLILYRLLIEFVKPKAKLLSRVDLQGDKFFIGETDLSTLVVSILAVNKTCYLVIKGQMV